MNNFGDVLAVTRKARGLTQTELGQSIGVTQATINRYESGEREPDRSTIVELAKTLNVTEKLLLHGDRFRGALAVDAHMRRQKTTKASIWRKTEARLNLLRIHASFLFEEVSIRSDQRVPTFDPEYTSPEDAARLVRAQWRMPIGPVVNLTRWLEAAGCLVFKEDFETERIDGLSQWVADHPVILINSYASPGRRRLTLAHELAHLVLHSSEPSEEMEAQANAFAAEFLMPEAAIKSELRRLDLGTLVDLKREWGVSMQALLERAYRLGLVTASSRTSFYKTMNARGWKTNEPAENYIPIEEPMLLAKIGETLRARGVTRDEAASMAGFVSAEDNPFFPDHARLRAVPR